MTARPGDAVLRRVIALGGRLRADGVDAGVGQLHDAVAALGTVSLARREDVYWALRATLSGRREDGPAFDRAFAAVWGRGAPSAPAHDKGQGDAGEAGPADGQDTGAGDPTGLADRRKGDGDADGAHPERSRTSSREVLRTRDFARMSDAELREAIGAMRGLAGSIPRRRSRRDHPGRGAALDVRRTLRRSLRTGGLPVARAWRAPRTVPRRLVFLVDVSGSMEPYARPLMAFVAAALRAGVRTEAFAFGTRLTRLTGVLASRDVDRALAAAGRAVPDWSGGTRIGESLRAFNDDARARGATRGAVVVIASDGWERGDPALLAGQLARLRRTAHTLLWINPLAGNPTYRPLAAGMAAALPHLDAFLPCHDLRSLGALATLIETLPARRAAALPDRTETHAHAR